MSQGRGKHIARVQVPDEATQRAIDPLRERINGLNTELDGIAGLRDAIDGVIRFRLLESTDESLRDGDIELPNATLVKLRHDLGKRLQGWLLADLRGAASAGYVNRALVDGSSNEADDTTDLWLQADGFGATITVRVLVF